MNVLVAIISCPGRLGWSCGAEFEGNWQEPEDPEDEAPDNAMQLCPECGYCWVASWPGFSFRTEAG
jgi:hypothetical protein